MSLDAEKSALEAGREVAGRLNPGMEKALAARYDALLPGFSETVVEAAYGRFYARDGLDERTRYLCTLSALAAQGGQTRPQLQVNTRSALRAGVTPREIAEAVMQMGLYGGFPAMINGLNAVIEVFEDEGVAP